MKAIITMVIMILSLNSYAMDFKIKIPVKSINIEKKIDDGGSIEAPSFGAGEDEEEIIDDGGSIEAPSFGRD